MKAIEALGTIEQDRLVRLAEPLPSGVSGRVRLLILIDEDDLSEQDWMGEEDIYTLEDGKPFTAAR